MKKLFIFFSLLPFFVHAQFGIRASYQFENVPAYEDALVGKFLEDADVFDSYALGLDYWIRLKKIRLEFYPTLQYQRNTSSNLNSLDGLDRSLKVQKLGFQFNTHVYFLNFADDCDCPTFSKQDPILKRGLFLLLSPGVDLVAQSFKVAGEEGDSFRNENVVGSLGIGLGLDLGVSDVLTITPYGGIRFYGKSNFLSDFAGLETINGASEQIFFGVRLGIRFDEINKYGFR